jgi:hypothetical protein
MIVFIAISILIGFLLGWIWRDHKWKRAGRLKEFMVIDGKLYTVKEHINEHTGDN